MSTRTRLVWLLVIALACLASCTSEKHSPERAPKAVVTVTNRQVFLGEIGPFVKRADGVYVCPDPQGRGEHCLRKSSDGWYHEWTYVQMQGFPVDGRALPEE